MTSSAPQLVGHALVDSTPMQPRLVALFALAFVLYVVASVGAAGATLDWGVLALAGVGAASALMPLTLLRREREPGAALVATLGVVESIALAARLASSAHGLIAELLGALALPAVGWMVLRLSLRIPDTPPRLGSAFLIAPLATVLAAGAALVGATSALPPFALGARALILPHAWSLAPVAALALMTLAALALRLSRRALGSSVRALAANLWATLGTLAATLTLALRLVLSGELGRAPLHALEALAAALLAIGHAWAIAPARVQVASAWARELGASLSSLVATGLFAWALAQAWTGAWPWLSVPALLAFLLVRRGLRKLAPRLLGPHRGRLLRAIEEARQAAHGAETYEELAARVLRPLRRAGALPETAPRLVTFDPPTIAQLDAAGIARVVEQTLPRVVVEQLEGRLGEPLVPRELSVFLPRRPHLAGVVKALDELDVLCLLPLVSAGGLEGALLVARGRRREPLTLEELSALERLSREIAPVAAGFLALERARLRLDAALAERAALAQQLEEQRQQLDELRIQTRAVKQGLGLPLPERDAVQYSPAMRELCARLERVAPHDLPVLLWGETGLSLAPLAESLHRASGRRDAPFVIVDGLTLDGERGLARLFGVGAGEDEKPGLLTLIGRGTLLLTDLPAVPLEVQRALAQALEERCVRPVRSGATHPLDARLVATARQPLADLSLAKELARWFESTTFGVPPLRERPEDLESLLLLALDRAARVLGRPAKGVEAEALKALIEYEWPGNDAELVSVIERAAACAEGARITHRDLPILPVGATAMAGGSFVEQEREILRRALKQSGGDRTRAARALGLKRATLVDKLQQLGVDDPTSAEN